MVTTLEAEISLMSFFNFRTKYIVPNVSWGANIHECDLLIITKIGYATEVEIKVSKADLLKDKDKRHGHKSKKIKELYFAVPSELVEIAKKEIPERAGLISIYKKEKWKTPQCSIVRKAIIAKNPYKWTEKEIMNVLRLGTLRIYNLKYKVNSLKNKL